MVKTKAETRAETVDTPPLEDAKKPSFQRDAAFGVCVAVVLAGLLWLAVTLIYLWLR